MKRLILIICIILGCVFQCRMASATEYVAVIGDSITHAVAGTEGKYGYRYFLWRSLVLAGADFDFVGSENTNAYDVFQSRPRCGCTLFDQDHEGHGGYKADQIVTSLASWMSGYANSPDVALIHIGTVDLYNDETVSSTEDDIEDIIDLLRAENANIIILLAQIIPIEDAGTNTDIDTLNAALPALVAGWTTEASPITLVDCNTGFVVATDTYDGNHPDESGEAKIAAAFFTALDGILY